ncbi:hypothetical protein ABTL19_19390, partial [Acinetobacter baumannii]
ALQLGHVGEQDVDAAVPHEAEELVAVAAHAERVREGQRDGVARLMGELRGLAERVLGGRRIPELALEIDDAGRAHERLVDIVGRQALAG